MTKKYFLLCLVAISVLTANGQHYFEGKIIYKFDFASHLIKEPSKLLAPLMGPGSTLYFKEGNYRHEYEGGILEFDLYIQKESKFYQKKRDNDTIYWKDCSVADNKILDSSYLAKTDTVLGIICDRFEIKYKESSEIHYFNLDSVYINPEWFKNYKSNDEYLIDLREKSIYLKSEHSFQYFKLIETATQINRQTVEFDKFRIFKNAILAKME